MTRRPFRELCMYYNLPAADKSEYIDFTNQIARYPKTDEFNCTYLSTISDSQKKQVPGWKKTKTNDRVILLLHFRSMLGIFERGQKERN